MAMKMYISGPSWLLILELVADTSTVIFTLSLVLIVAAGYIFGA